jgi:hypothetical protein
MIGRLLSLILLLQHLFLNTVCPRDPQGKLKVSSSKLDTNL